MKKSWIVIAAAVGLVIVGSLAVLRSSGDDSRRQGALGSQEAVALSWRGDWSGEAQYTPGNVVAHEGASYVAEGEKLSAPEPGCTECGWQFMGSEIVPPDAQEPEKEEAAPPPVALTDYEVVTHDASFAPATGKYLSVTCPGGKKILSAGWEQTGQQVHPDLFAVDGGSPAVPLIGGASGWSFVVQVDSGLPRDVTLRAFGVCARG